MSHFKILTTEEFIKQCIFLDLLPESITLFITMEGGQEQKKTDQQEKHSSVLSNIQYETIYFQNKAECVRDTSSIPIALVFPFMYFNLANREKLGSQKKRNSEPIYIERGLFLQNHYFQLSCIFSYNTAVHP